MITSVVSDPILRVKTDPETVEDAVAFCGFVETPTDEALALQTEFEKQFWSKRLFGSFIWNNRIFVQKHARGAMSALAMLAVSGLSSFSGISFFFIAKDFDQPVMALLGVLALAVGAFAILLNGRANYFVRFFWESLPLAVYVEHSELPTIPKELRVKVWALQRMLVKFGLGNVFVEFYGCDPWIYVQTPQGRKSYLTNFE